MKHITGFLFILVLVVTPCSARDFMVEFLAENYKETRVPYSKTPRIYHSIQVNTHAGPKLLILKGDDLDYRTWLRQYIAENNQFIARVADEENDLFVASRAYEIDVTRLHPVTNENWSALFNQDGAAEKIAITGGDRHILVVDANPTRSRLIGDVINALGYTAIVSGSGAQGLEMFRIQPEKFKMIIANHKAPGVETETFVKQILKIDRTIPVLVETGYRDSKTRQHYQALFAGAGSVVLTPMVLKNLQKNIQNLIKNMTTEQPPANGREETAS